MKLAKNKLRQSSSRGESGVTLVEAIIAFAISGLMVAGIVQGYVYSIRASQRYALCQAADAMASMRMEEMRSAQWDTAVYPVIDQLGTTNFTNQAVLIDMSGTGAATTYATNFATISMVSTNPPLKRIRIDCVWSPDNIHVLTNTIESLRAPDQ